jgi:hypothetical protein
MPCSRTPGSRFEPAGKKLQCDACGTPIVACALDPECRAALECLGTCSGDNCSQACIDPHSSGLGLLAQMQGCIDYRCTACSAPSGN